MYSSSTTTFLEIEIPSCVSLYWKILYSLITSSLLKITGTVINVDCNVHSFRQWGRHRFVDSSSSILGGWLVDCWGEVTGKVGIVLSGRVA